MATTYRYEAYRRGQKKPIRGTHTSSDKPTALREISAIHKNEVRISDCVPVKGGIASFNDAWLRLQWMAFGNNIRLQFFRQFSAMMNTGTGPEQALEQCIRTTQDARFKRALQLILVDIAVGRVPLSEAFRKHTEFFSEIECELIALGNAGVTLSRAFTDISADLTRDRKVRHKIAMTLMMPSLTIAFSFIVGLIAAVSVPNTYGPMYKDLHLTLPLSTQILADIGAAVGDPRHILLALVALCGAGFALFRSGRTKRVIEWLDRVRFKIPIYGPMMRKMITARIAGLLATLYGSKVSLPRALQLISNVTGSMMFSKALHAVSADLARGSRSLIDSMEVTGVFDHDFIALARTGSEHGALVDLLQKRAEDYSMETELAVEQMVPVLTMASYAVIFVMVGFLMLATYEPTWKLITSIHT